MSPRSSPPTSERSRNSSIIVLLSGEALTLPEAEARALILAQDEGANIEKIEDRLLLARTTADPSIIAGRIAFSRRVGELVPEGDLKSIGKKLKGSRFRVKTFSTHNGKPETENIISSVANQIAGKVDLENPDFEISVVCGERRDYYALTTPGVMRQDWIRRRPRGRAYFHPAAMFPKISRCFVNLTRVNPGGILLDPFVGTGSILLEADIVGACALGIDLSRKMTRGAKRNQEKYDQRWLGIVRADSRALPLQTVDAIATDVPYGRASSTEGSATGSILESLVLQSGQLLRANGRLVVMHPLSVQVPRNDAFRMEGEHLIYTHRKLTRAISVLRRV